MILKTLSVFSLLVLLLAGTAVPALAGSPDPETEKRQTPAEDEEAWDAEAADTGRSFLYKEVVLSSAYGRNMDNVELSHRPPGSYVAVDYVRTFTPASRVNKGLPGWFQLSAVDLHPRLVYYGDMNDEESMVMEGPGADYPMPDGREVDFAPQDFWVRFQLAGRDRLTLRLGQVALPYGVNPLLAPRQTFLLPVEELDLGLKWDWGMALKGPLGAFDWELAATVGSGEAWHSSTSRPGSRLLSGRVGTPTYWDVQYGLSFLVGELPTLHGPYVSESFSLSRWRVSLDGMYKRGTYLVMGAQVTYGEDGYDGDHERVLINGGSAPARVFGYRAFVDWVVPDVHDLRLGGQIESVVRDLDTPSTTESAAIVELGYSLTTALTLKLDYRMEIEDFMGREDNAFFITLVFYHL